MNPSDLDILYALGRIESELTNDVGLDLLHAICQHEAYAAALTVEDKRFLLSLRIAID